MTNRRASFSQADLTRALKAARAAGIDVERVEIQGSKIVVVFRGEASASKGTDSWSDVA